MADRLRSRRAEIEQALLARIIMVPGGAADPEYREGLRAITPAALDFSIAAIEARDGEVPPIPAELLHQARLAARHKVGLDAVFRGYIAGSTLLDDFILEESADDEVQRLLRQRAAALQHLLSRVSDEHESERRSRDTTHTDRMLERVNELLRGERRAWPDGQYDFAWNHVALVVRGATSRRVVLEALKSIDCRVLVVEPGPDAIWAWAGRRTFLGVDEVQTALTSLTVLGVSIGIGEGADGIGGWRQSHHQAKAVLPVAARSKTHVARYADFCLLASALQDNLLRTSLMEICIQPLLGGRDGGAMHLTTLRAYFSAHRNRNSAAAILGLSRQTVANRLRVVEERLGRPLSSCATIMEVALSLDEIDPHRS